MFRKVYAIRFDRPAGNGRNKACFIECADMSNQRIEVIVKFTACESGVQGLIREALAAFLAADLGLQVPKPILVEIMQNFTAGHAYPEHNALIAGSSKLALGSEALGPGYSIWAPALKLPAPLVQKAADIFAFDTLIANSDRTDSNPNCLVQGDELVPIDHDLAFLLDALFWKEPWVRDRHNELVGTHIFWNEIKKQALDFTRLSESLKSISDERLTEYLASIPSEWKAGNNTAGRVVDYIKNLRDNADDAFSEIQRVLQ